MKKIAPFRRTQSGQFAAGFTERVVWQLSKRPHTGEELRHIFKLDLRSFTRQMRNSFRGQTSRVDFREPVNIDGVTDYTYHLISVKRCTRTVGESVVIGSKTKPRKDRLTREQYIEQAKCRARLIKAGLFPFGVSEAQ